MFSEQDSLIIRLKIRLKSFKYCLVCGEESEGSNRIASALNHIISSNCFSDKRNVLEFKIVEFDADQEEVFESDKVEEINLKESNDDDDENDDLTNNEISNSIEVSEHTYSKDDFGLVAGDEFTTEENYNGIQREDSGEKQIKLVESFKFACDVCNASFRRETNLKMHMNFSHRENYSCDLCNNSCTDSSDLIQHIKSSHADVPTCFICKKTVKNLGVHLRSHLGQRDFKCSKSDCDQRFVHPESVKKHEKIHQGITYDCHLCHASLSKEANLRHHLEVIHQQEDTFHCGYCQQWFKTHQLLFQHLKEQHEVGTQNKVPCEFCGLKYTSKGLKEHIRLCHSELNAPKQRPSQESAEPFQQKSVECSKCGAAFQSQQAKEIKSHADGCRSQAGEDCDGIGQSYSCRYKPCQAKYKDFSQLLHHELFLHTFPPVEISCQACAESFGIDWSAFGDHLVNRHWKEIPRVDCVVCGENLNADLVKLHYYQHTGTSLHRCKDCPMSFIDVKSFRSHCSSHQTSQKKQQQQQAVQKKDLPSLSSPAGQQFCCLLCGFATRTSWNKLVNHLPIHDQLPQIVCQEKSCSSEFKTLEELHRHFYTIHKQCFECETCHLLLTSKTFHDVHQRSHLSAKAEQCKFCPKTFRTKVQREIHEARHTGEGRYKCDQCGKCFPQKGELRNHKEQHADAKAYTCHQCGKSFARDSYLRVHMKTHGKTKKKKNKGSGKEEGLMIHLESTIEQLPWNHTFMLP